MKIFWSILVPALVAGVTNQSYGAESLCQAGSDMSYICDIENAEDLVLIPDTRWVLASGYSPGGAVYAIDSESRAFHQAYEPAKTSYQTETYPACSTPPQASSFVSHGLSIQPGENGHSTLYVVGHGGREAIEVFDVAVTDSGPELTWAGCVMMPEGLDANSVAVMRDGSLRLTVLMHPGNTFTQIFEGVKTGAVYGWSPGDVAIEKIIGSELPGNNGIEVSLDGKEMYVVSTGLSTISVFSNTNPTRLLRTTPRLNFSPDNIHMTSGGLLLTGGPSWVDHNCATGEEFSLEEFAACPRGSVGATFDPITLEEVERWTAGPSSVFSNSTMALEVGAEIWFGTFSGTRIGIINTD